jgi:hypothetical protein
MSTNLNRGSATIYAFPARGRFAVGAYREEAMPAAELQSPRMSETVLTGSWYHEEAVRDADRTRKH